MTKEEILKTAIDVLNDAIARDRVAISMLMQTRMACNDALANHPTIQVNGSAARPLVGPMGIINGILEALTGSRLMYEFEDIPGCPKLIRFGMYPQELIDLEKRTSTMEKKDTEQRLFITAFGMIAEDAHRNSREKGFWQVYEKIKALPDREFADQLDTLFKLSRIALIHSEASESLEGIRKRLTDDHVPEFSMEVAELADVIIRIMDYAAGFNLPVAEAVIAKMEYNRGRPFMHGDKKA